MNVLRGGQVFAASADHHVSPTYVPHLANAVLDLLLDGATGLWHASNGEEMAWSDFARRIAGACNLDESAVRDAPPHELGWVAARPKRSGLMSRHGQLLPPLDHAISEFAAAV